MRWLASLAPKRRLIHDFKQIAELRHRRQQQRDDGDRAQLERAEPPRDQHARRSTAPSAPAMAPAQVFFGLTAGANFGPPIARPAK